MDNKDLKCRIGAVGGQALVEGVMMKSKKHTAGRRYAIMRSFANYRSSSMRSLGIRPRDLFTIFLSFITTRVGMLIT